jgi:alanyl-tRNA synthetase
VTAVKLPLDTAVISLVRKNALKAQLSKLQKVLADANKAAAVANKAAVVEAAKAAAAAAAEAGAKYCVVRTTVSDAAAVREAVVAVQKADNVAIALFSVDEAKDKLMLYTAVPPSVKLGAHRAPSSDLCAGEAISIAYVHTVC